MTCEDVQSVLEDALPRGRPLSPEVQAHLAACPECRAQAAELRRVHVALGESVPEVAPPPDLKNAVMRAARRSKVRGRPPRPTASRPSAPRSSAPRWLAAAGLAAAIAFGLLWPLRSGTASAALLPDPAVVVTYGDSLVVASNVAGRAAVSLVDGRGKVTALDLPSPPSPRAAWFTEGVRLGARVYLADAAGDRVVVVDVPSRRVVASLPVAGGIAGLAAENGQIVYKTVGGGMGRLNGAARRLVPSAPAAAALPLQDVMDAVALEGGTLFVTHHLRGDLYLLDPKTLATRRRVHVGGAPVALAAYQGGVLVLDRKGALLWVDGTGKVRRRTALPGSPDKLVLSGGQAFVSDRGGAVTRLDIATGELLTRHFEKPMDLAPMQGGHLALADGAGGVRILDADLNVMETYGRS